MAKKKIYAVLWIDDYGSLKLRRKDVDWYHRNAGPISYAIQCDERFPWSFDLLLNGKNDFSQDYLGYHYHPIRYKGLKIPKKIYDSLRLYSLVHAFLRGLNLKMDKKTFRLLTGATFLFALIAVALTFIVDVRVFLMFGLICVLIAVLAAIWYYVERRENWEFPISNADWNRSFIGGAKREFERRGYEFPRIVRHGWNLPWKGSMKFYIDLGFVADASANTEHHDHTPSIGDRALTWVVTQPYYASASRDYDVPWDGRDPEDKGILELPIMLGNVSVYGFGEEEKRAIAAVPDGGLVGVYIHPQDDFWPIKEWVLYLKKTYEVDFISAWQAYEIYEKIA